jgi:hypothetical protein
MTPIQQNDQKWFQDHPNRAYRLRTALGDEITEGPNRVIHFTENSMTGKSVQALAYFNTEADAKDAFEGVAR